MSDVTKERVRYAKPEPEVEELRRKHTQLCEQNKWSMNAKDTYDLTSTRYVSQYHPPKKGSKLRTGTPKEKK